MRLLVVALVLLAPLLWWLVSNVPFRVTLDPKVMDNFDADRTAAEYVLSTGGEVGVNDQGRAITLATELPREPFRLTMVYWNGQPNVTDVGLAHFEGCKNVTVLSMWATPVTDTGLAHFKECKSLTQLNVGHTHVTDNGLVHFSDCINLSEINLNFTAVSDTGLTRLQHCKSLTVLGLASTKVTDTGLLVFKDCKTFTSLDVSGTQVSNAGLALFKDCKNLIILNLTNTKVTDLSPLKNMPLKALYCDFDHERDTEILRSIKTLEMINGKPAKEFWKEVEAKKP